MSDLLNLHGIGYLLLGGHSALVTIVLSRFVGRQEKFRVGRGEGLRGNANRWEGYRLVPKVVLVLRCPPNGLALSIIPNGTLWIALMTPTMRRRKRRRFGGLRVMVKMMRTKRIIRQETMMTRRTGRIVHRKMTTMTRKIVVMTTKHPAAQKTMTTKCATQDHHWPLYNVHGIQTLPTLINHVPHALHPMHNIVAHDVNLCGTAMLHVKGDIIPFIN
jgi:hypothetical protein